MRIDRKASFCIAVYEREGSRLGLTPPPDQSEAVSLTWFGTEPLALGFARKLFAAFEGHVHHAHVIAVYRPHRHVPFFMILASGEEMLWK